MRFYRVFFNSDHDSSCGFGWFTNKREAKRAAREWEREDPDDHRTEIESVDVDSTKRGILSALKIYATHPDNG